MQYTRGGSPADPTQLLFRYLSVLTVIAPRATLLSIAVHLVRTVFVMWA